MRINNIILCIMLFLLSLLSLKSFSQELENNTEETSNYVIAILTYTPSTQTVYYDTTRYVANQLSDILRRIPNVQTLNISSTSRYLKDADINKQYNYLIDTLSLSDNPDPENLSKIAEKIGANKIIIVSSFFDTQRDIMTKGVTSHFNIFDRRIIRPRYDYTVYIKMYDPSSGVLEWSQNFNTTFNIDEFYLATQKMTDNPMFLQTFNKFAVNISDQAFLDLQKYLYGTQIVSVTGQIILDNGKNQATDGDMTMDGHPYYPNNNPSVNYVNIPYSAQKQKQPTVSNQNTNKDNTISKTQSNTTNLSKIKPQYQSEILEEYKKNLINKY